jgi:N-hydroxyarylamine O-acetyltransferase
MLDTDAYFARIGYEGKASADLATLSALHALHPAAIVFENLDPLLGRPVPLDLAALQAKLVTGGRGGYCFEQNTLFKAVLEALGFSVTSLAARVLWMVPPGAPPNPRAHMVLKVTLPEGAYLADVGFGGLLASAPLRLLYDVEQPTPAGVLRLVESDGLVTLQAKLASHWQDVYRFTLEPQFPIDFEVANWFTSTHPNSRFRNVLMVQRLTPKGRVSLFNRRLARRFADGRVEEVMLTDARELEQTLKTEFDLAPPADLTPVFARLPAS